MGEALGSGVLSVQGCSRGKSHSNGGRKHGLARHFQFFQLGFMETLCFGSPVLKPDFDLSLCEIKGGRELGSLGDGQVLFLPELALQGQELRRGKWRPWFPVGFVFP